MNEYLELVEEAQNERIKLTKERVKSIRDLYRDLAKDLNRKAKGANKGSLNERWLLDYQKQFKNDIKQLNKILKRDIESSMLKSAEYANNIQLDFFNLLDIKYNLNSKETFSNMFSKIPQQALEELINGEFYKDGRGVSERLWFHEMKANANFDYIIQRGLAEKKSVYDLAKDLSDYVNPDVKKDWNFKKIYSGVGNKKIEYNSFRLAITSISHAYQLSMQRSCKANPFVEGIQWHTSNSHRNTCSICRSRNGKVYKADELPLDHPNGICYFTPVIKKNMENIGTELRDWVNGGKNSKLNAWYNLYSGPLGEENNLFRKNNKDTYNINYMSNRFIPKFGEEQEVKLGDLVIKEKKVSNSQFNMWTDIDTTNKNKAVRLYEKKIKSIKDNLPQWFELPKISIIDFEKVGLNKKAIGGYQRQINTIFMNSKYDTDAKILKYLKGNEGYFASIESNSPLLHELGHKYHYDLVELIANQKRLSYNNAKEIFDSEIENYILSKSLTPNMFIEDQLSGYAADSYIGIDRVNEIIAEYFSIRDNNNNNKTELVQFIEDYIKGVEKS